MLHSQMQLLSLPEDSLLPQSRILLKHLLRLLSAGAACEKKQYQGQHQRKETCAVTPAIFREKRNVCGYSSDFPNS